MREGAPRYDGRMSNAPWVSTGPASSGEGAREKWQETTRVPLGILALVFIASYAAPILRPSLPTDVILTFHALNVITYLAFVGDYFARLHLSRDRHGFLRHSGLDVLVLVPPALQPLRTMQLIALLRLLDKRLGRTLRGRIVAYLGFATLTVLLLGALAVLDAERKAPGANIHTFGDALWWATTTITTVGYGEHHPVTPSGRVVAACLMFSGIALFSVVTGSVASWILDRVREEDGEVAADDRMRDEVEALTHEIRALRADVAELRGRTASHRAAAPESDDIL